MNPNISQIRDTKARPALPLEHLLTVIPGSISSLSLSAVSWFEAARRWGTLLVMTSIWH
jgi:hypothetical protein